MSLTILVTRDVAARYRGFLASVMPELAPGVYVAPGMTAAVRQRVWAVMEEWWAATPGTAAVMAYPDRDAPGRLAIKTLGAPPVELADVDGLRVVVRRAASSSGSG